MRIAPEGGYGFEAKEDYRRRLWLKFKSFCGLDRWRTDCLIMPSKEGREIEVALENGFHESRLHVVDFEPAIVANLKRRFKGINTYGVSVDRACAKMEKKGIRLRVANLDLTKCLGVDLAKTLARVGSRNCWHESSLTAVTVLRGREHPETLDWARVFSFVPAFATGRPLRDSDLARINQIHTWLSGTFSVPGDVDGDRWFECWDGWHQREGSYLLPKYADYYTSSNGQSMMWAIFERFDGDTPRKRTYGEIARRLRACETTNALAIAAMVKEAMEGNTAVQSILSRDNSRGTNTLLRQMGVWEYLPEAAA